MFIPTAAQEFIANLLFMLILGEFYWIYLSQLQPITPVPHL